MKNIVAVIPTRGLVHARTLESLKENGITDIEIVSGFPIPDSHNECVRRTLHEMREYVLFVEDDMVLPPHAVERMVKLDKPIVAIDYSLDNGYGCACKKGDEYLWCGLGCTLVKQILFRKIPAPWFETDHSYRIESESPLVLTKTDIPSKYGGQDINFFMKCRNYGYTVTLLEGMEAKHLRVKELEHTMSSNDGRYEVVELPPISKRQVYS